jgi:hypothetical protein
MMEHAMTQRKRSSPGASPLTLTHPNAAGIDIGSASHFVAVPPDRDDEPVREFRSFTAELSALADWLAECGIDTVAIEAALPVLLRLDLNAPAFELGFATSKSLVIKVAHNCLRNPDELVGRAS